MQLSEILSRLTGFSTPIGGVSWQPGTPDVEVGRRVFDFLEDRRVLFTPAAAETPDYCVESVLQIRKFLTDVLTNQGIGNDLAGHLKGMRAACRRFLDQLDVRHASEISFEDIREDFKDIREDYTMNNILGQALGELRAVFGFQVAQIAAEYRLDVPDTLSFTIDTALPPDQDDEE